MCIYVCVHLESKSKLSGEVSQPHTRRVEASGTVRHECDCGVTDIKTKFGKLLYTN